MSSKAVVLAAGRGTRMQSDTEDVELDDAQRAAAAGGLKALIPFNGEPFIRYVLTALADAGLRDVCLVIRPGDDPIRAHFASAPVRRLALHYGVQQTPEGSADALLSAESFAAGDDVIVINADNYYPVAALARLRDAAGDALIGCRRGALLAGNITEERLAGYALVTTDAAGDLAGIVEKPSHEEIERHGPDALISMTCWRFTPAVFDACRTVPISGRGELELPEAVRRMIDGPAGRARIQVIPMDAAVLDLSRREDIPRVADLLARERVDL